MTSHDAMSSLFFIDISLGETERAGEATPPNGIADQPALSVNSRIERI